MVLAPSAFASNGNGANSNNIGAPALNGPMGGFGVGQLVPVDPVTGQPVLGPNDKISASCPSGLVAAAENGGIFFGFTDGNGHFYQGAAVDPGSIGVGTGGANGEGDAFLYVGGPPAAGGTKTASGFLHAWVGYNTNPNAPGNLQYVFAQTFAFTGTITSTGQSISINANPGGTTSASGNQNGWGQLTMTCS
jgi:hypothetical protein